MNRTPHDIPGNSTVTGVIFNIQRCSVHDGPGIRTTVFTKGCNLRCFWCHNPEGLSPRQELQYFSNRCLLCGECIQVCPQQAIWIDGRTLRLDRDRCQACGQCVDPCLGNARMLAGRTVTVQQVMDEVLQDRVFYETSGGGVTISGGEPLLQRQFTTKILQSCRQAGIHTAVETAGNYDWRVLESLLEWTDLVMMDLKLIDPLEHQRATGVRNDRILETARRLALTDKPLIFRTPIIPGVNDSRETAGAIAAQVQALWSRRREQQGEGAKPIRAELLAFHPLAADKYRSLDLVNRAEGLRAPSKEKMSELEQVFRDYQVALVSHG